MKLLITVPTYNEAQNIVLFIKTVFENIPKEAEILIIDDNSPDGTASLVEQLIQSFPLRLHLLNRSHKQGLALAYLAAFEWGLSRNYDVFLQMDADFSHNPKYIPIMLAEIDKYDVVIGSRNIKGGGVEGWSMLRKLVSKGGSLYSRIVLGCPINDFTGGFNLWKKSALLNIDLQKIISKGYSFQVEMKYKAYCKGCLTKEVPILFSDRKLGKSKMSQGIFFEALINIWKIRNNIKFNHLLDEIVKFAVTGGLGTITNLVLFFLLVDKIHLSEIPVSIGCFLIAATQNYIINHRWSFRQQSLISLKRWFLFILGSISGLFVNIFIMKMILLHYSVPYKFIAQAFGIAAGMVINFIVSKFIIFKEKKTTN
jgi:dolichol-phosphate mannosyltransferase